MRQRYSPPEYHRRIKRPKAGDWAHPMLWNWEIQGSQHTISMQKLRFPNHPRTKVRWQVPPDQVVLEHSADFGNIAVYCKYIMQKPQAQMWQLFCLCWMVLFLSSKDKKRVTQTFPGFNPLILGRSKIWILICCPYSFPTEVVGRNW